jgi:hypothetical protein
MVAWKLTSPADPAAPSSAKPPQKPTERSNADVHPINVCSSAKKKLKKIVSGFWRRFAFQEQDAIFSVDEASTGAGDARQLNHQERRHVDAGLRVAVGLSARAAVGG